ncbi:MAG: M14 family zinc carboxypeptidase [Nitrososphaeraceae archaeon]
MIFVIVVSTKKGALFLGDVHAREIVNPDLLLSFSLDLCREYTAQSSLKYGKASSSSFDKFDVRKVVDGLDVFIIPLVNPGPGSYQSYKHLTSYNA